jgi:hypothetical protein
VIAVLTEDGIRFNGNGTADTAQRITAAELSALIDVLDEDAIDGDAIESADSPPAESAGQVEIADRFHPSASLTIDAADREQVREKLRSGLSTEQVYRAMGAKRAYWLTAIEEEARLDNELAAYPGNPHSVAALRDERQLRWERIAARVFGDARRTDEVRSLYDEAQGPGASSRSYNGRDRRFPEMNP